MNSRCWATRTFNTCSASSRVGAAEGWQPQGDASGIRSCAHPVTLAHPEERLDGGGADRHADVIEPEGRGGLELVVQIGAKLLTESGGGHRVNRRFTLGAGAFPSPGVLSIAWQASRPPASP